jgi:hypothetical protein
MPPTYRQRKRIPKPQEIIRVMHILRATIPMDARPLFGWRESLKGVPNFRIQSLTNEKEWVVDTYAGGFYVIMIKGRQTDTCKTIPSLVGCLCRMLGVRLDRKPTD